MIMQWKYKRFPMLYYVLFCIILFRLTTNTLVCNFWTSNAHIHNFLNVFRMILILVIFTYNNGLIIGRLTLNDKNLMHVLKNNHSSGGWYLAAGIKQRCHTGSSIIVREHVLRVPLVYFIWRMDIPEVMCFLLWWREDPASVVQ